MRRPFFLFFCWLFINAAYSLAESADIIIYMTNGTGTIRADRTWEQGDQLCWDSRGYQSCLPMDRVTLTPPAGILPSRSSGSPRPEVETRSKNIYRELMINLVDLEMSWYVSRSMLQKETIIQPQLEFSVRNSSASTHQNLRFKCVFLQPGNVVFDSAEDSISDLRSGYTSPTLFLRPATGFVDKGRGPSGVKNDLRYELFLLHSGQEILVDNAYFSPSRVK